MAFLVSLGDDRGFASVMYRFDQESFMVLDPEDYDWTSKVSVLRRDQIIGTPFAAQTFRVLDEIWLHDPAVKAWVAEVERGKDRGESLVGRFLRFVGLHR